jgi:hypothetical protein
MTLQSVALIAGEGNLPEEIVSRLAERNRVPLVYALGGPTDRFSSLKAVEVVPMASPDLDFVIGDLLKRGIKNMMLAGRVPKTLMYRTEILGESLQALLQNLESADDHSLLGAIVSVIESAGIRVMPYKDVIPDLLAPSGPVAGRTPTASEMEDINYARGIARVLLPLSFGQTLAVYRKAVIAVEAMEGTDMTIRRAGDIVGRGVLVKMMREDQDERYDLPTVGPSTLKNMAEAGLACLAVEAGRTIVLCRKEFSRIAREAGIAVWGIG